MTNSGISSWDAFTANPLLLELLRLLAAKWTATPPLSETRTATRTGYDVSTGVRVETCKEIHSFLFHLVQRRAPGIESVGFLGVKTCGTVQLLHSLFILPLGPYDDSTPRLCAERRPRYQTPQHRPLNPDGICNKRYLPGKLGGGV